MLNVVRDNLGKCMEDSKHVIISQTTGFKTLAGFELASNIVYITINYKEILDPSDLLLLLLHKGYANRQGQHIYINIRKRHKEKKKN